MVVMEYIEARACEYQLSIDLLLFGHQLKTTKKEMILSTRKV